MKSNNEDSSKVCDDIIEQVLSDYKGYKLEGDTRQLHTQMHPIVSNAMFQRENELLEQERFKVLITLARTLDDENVNKAIVALKYQLTIKK